MSKVRLWLGGGQQGGGRVLFRQVSGEKRLLLQLQQGGHVGFASPQEAEVWRLGRGHVVHQLFPWANQRETGSQVIRRHQSLVVSETTHSFPTYYLGARSE